uniref:SFRICE_011233 n=1 Tax=Spodoptera frugiperda TaxID=7108 RepID=A0A2H1VQ32_SPOFR
MELRTIHGLPGLQLEEQDFGRDRLSSFERAVKKMITGLGEKVNKNHQYKALLRLRIGNHAPDILTIYQDQDQDQYIKSQSQERCKRIETELKSRCLPVNYAETTERILKKFGIQTGYELTWVFAGQWAFFTSTTQEGLQLYRDVLSATRLPISMPGTWVADCRIVRKMCPMDAWISTRAAHLLLTDIMRRRVFVAQVTGRLQNSTYNFGTGLRVARRPTRYRDESSARGVPTALQRAIRSQHQTTIGRANKQAPV